MPLDPQFLSLMLDRITVTQVTASTSDLGYGKRTSGDSFPVKARIEQLLKTVRSKSGHEPGSRTRVYCAPFDDTIDHLPFALKVTDIITLPSGYSSNPTGEVERHNDDRGIMYYAFLM